MPQRFGQQVDPSQTFAYLAGRNTDVLRSRAEAHDRRIEEERAARDSLMFTRYAEGKISGAQILAHIRSRIAQTGYDRAQQLRWREALAQYSNSIADETAEAAYAETQDIHALVRHYRGRLRSTAKGTPEYRELATRLQALRTKRDSEDFQKALTRLNNQIVRGDRSKADLVKFYRDYLNQLPANSELRSEVQGRLAEARADLRNERFTTAMQKIDIQLSQGRISPQQAGEQKRVVLSRFDIETRDPATFWQWMNEINTLKATPNPVELEQLETRLKQGKISVADYQGRLREMANRIAPYSAEAAWRLRQEAAKGISGATPLSNPEALGLGDRRRNGGGGNLSPRAYQGNGGLKHITQLDGSKYSQLNCTMAAAAMLAHAMGYEDLSGGDLRWLTGDTIGGTTIVQAQAALNKAGVSGTKARYHDRIEFEQFKKRVASGAPAVLSGWNGDIPGGFNSSGIIGGHAMFVAGYDPKKGFLMYDPAKSRDKGTWWPERVVRDFGWVGERHGQALFAPRGTVHPRTLKRKGGKAIQHVSVNANPRRRGTPPTYTGQFNPGRDDKRTATEAAKRAQKREDRRVRRRLERAGIDEEIDTVEEANEDLALRDKFLIQTRSYIDEFLAKWDGTDDAVSVTIGTDTLDLTVDDIGQLQRDVLYSMDGQEVLYEALGKPEQAAKIREGKLAVLKQAAEIDAVEDEVLVNTTARTLMAELASADSQSDPRKVGETIERVVETLEAIATQRSGDDEDDEDEREDDATEGAPAPTAPDDASIDSAIDQQVASMDEMEETVQSLAGLRSVLDAIRDPDVRPEDREAMVLEWAAQADVDLPDGWPDGDDPTPSDNPLGELLAATVAGANQFYAVENGEAEYAIIKGELRAVPTTADAGFTDSGQRDTETIDVPVEGPEGQQAEVPVSAGAGTSIDLSQIDDLPPGYSHEDELPKVFLRMWGRVEAVTVVPEQVPYGQRIGADGALDGNPLQFLKVANASRVKELGISVNDSGHLSADDIAALASQGGDTIRRLVQEGALAEEPFLVMQVRTPPTAENPLGDIWFQDPGTDLWHKDGYPFLESATRGGTQRGSNYVGADPDTEPGTPVRPDVSWDLDLNEPSSVGVPYPFAAGVSTGTAARVWERGVAEGRWTAPTRTRDADGNIVDPGAVGSLGGTRNPYGDFVPLGEAIGRVRDNIRQIAQAAEQGARVVQERNQRARTAEQVTARMEADIPTGGGGIGSGLGLGDTLSRLEQEMGITSSQQQQELSRIPPPPQIQRADIEVEKRPEKKEPLPRIRPPEPRPAPSPAPTPRGKDTRRPAPPPPPKSRPAPPKRTPSPKPPPKSRPAPPKRDKKPDPVATRPPQWWWQPPTTTTPKAPPPGTGRRNF